MRVKYVRQEDQTSCGIACVAMLTGQTHRTVMQAARDIFNWGPRKQTFHTTSGQLRRLLAHFGVDSGRGRSVRDWDKLPDRAIVAINPGKDGRYWHWVVFCRHKDQAYVLDPESKKKEKRVSFRGIGLRSFIFVG